MAGLFTVQARIQKDIQETLECLQSLSDITECVQEIAQLQARIETRQQEVEQRFSYTIHQTEVTTQEPPHLLTVEALIYFVTSIHKKKFV